MCEKNTSLKLKKKLRFRLLHIVHFNIIFFRTSYLNKKSIKLFKSHVNYNNSKLNNLNLILI